MKKIIFVFLSLIYVLNVHSQEVEKICILEEVKYIGYPAGLGCYPQGIYYDEIDNIMVTQNRHPEAIVEIDLRTKEIREENKQIPHYTLIKKFGNDYWGISGRAIHPVINNKSTPVIQVSSGISFILKKDSGYIVYYVNESGTPGAVDTEGRIYSNKEALAYLKEYDPEKYAESLARAEELGLKAEFESENVLIWGQTYYSTVNTLEYFWGESVYMSSSSLIQYDLQGYGYDLQNLGYLGILLRCVNYNNKKVFELRDLYDYSKILTEEDGDYSLSWYVGYGGNIYYYIAGEEYTEVFRIRRTWGKADMYAMAINGYTEDNYGEYVKTTLAGMSKAELRLLRNTIFALYGVHFKSTDLSSHFSKEVWYTDEGKTSGEVELPAHRQKLVEMIQELERK